MHRGDVTHGDKMAPKLASKMAEYEATIWVFSQGRDGFVSLPNKEGKSICCATLLSSQAVADTLQHSAHLSFSQH